MYLIYDVAKYFDCIEPLQNKKILDFGCNHANFLRFGYTGDYTGIDVDKDVIENNKKEFPTYNFIHYNAHNNQYNISKHTSTEIPLVEKYDLICAFSVFTHTCFQEYKHTVEILKTHLAPGGKILTTFIDTDDIENIKKMFKYRYDILGSINIEKFLHTIKDYYSITIAVTLVDKNVKIYYNKFYIPNYNTPTYFITMYNGKWLKNQLQGKIFDVTDKFEDIRGGQKCLVIE